MAKQGTIGYSMWLRSLELTSIGAFGALSVASVPSFGKLAADRAVDAAGWIVLGGVVAGLLFSDFVSGLVHWAADNWGNPRWPVLGTHFIRPFREHHRDPRDITAHDFVELNGNNCLISLPTFWLAFGFTLPPAWALLNAVFWVSLAWWVLLTNQFHAWAHSPRPPRLVRWLQRARLILAPEHHNVHHQVPHNRNYCITTGWLNPVLRGLRFFEILEWCMTRLTGLRPLHHALQPKDPPAAEVPGELGVA